MMSVGRHIYSRQRTSQKSRAKVDEEGLEIAVCRHGILLQGLNHYRGEYMPTQLFFCKRSRHKLQMQHSFVQTLLAGK